MTGGKRILHFFIGIFLIIACVVILVFPDEGFIFVTFALSLTFLISGISSLIYFFTMAAFMVGGLRELYKAMIFLDFGLFLFNLDNLPQVLVMLYIAASLAFSGIVDIMHSFESKSMRSNLWKYEFGYGFIQISMAIISLFFLHSLRMMMIIYCIGLLHSAASHIIRAVKKTAIVFVE